MTYVCVRLAMVQRPNMANNEEGCRATGCHWCRGSGRHRLHRACFELPQQLPVTRNVILVEDCLVWPNWPVKRRYAPQVQRGDDTASQLKPSHSPRFCRALTSMSKNERGNSRNIR